MFLPCQDSTRPAVLKLHQATSKEIVQLLQNAGVCMSCNKVIQDGTLPEKTLNYQGPATGAVVSKNLIPGRKVTNGMDNIDV